MISIPKNYYSNLSCYEEFIIRTNILGYDVSNDELYDWLEKNYCISNVNCIRIIKDFCFFAVGDDVNRHLCIIDRKGNHIENAIIEGNFDCSSMNLTSLEGAPREVSGYFNCSSNNLTSLVGAPIEVGRSFDCSYNSLTSLEGTPVKVERDFDCSENKLTSLEGAPREVNGCFDCSYNNLTSLKGAPIEVGGYFNCSKNDLTSLEGAPREVDGSFWCSYNKLTDSQFRAYIKWLRKNPSCSYHDLYAT